MTDNHKSDGAGAIEEKPIKKVAFADKYNEKLQQNNCVTVTGKSRFLLWYPIFLARSRSRKIDHCAKPCLLHPPPAAHRRLCHRLRLAQSVRVTDSHKADGAGAIEEKPIKKGRKSDLFLLAPPVGLEPTAS